MTVKKNDIPQNKIKVSVVVPVYNVEKYLEECLESLIAQTLSDIEIILVDDGSTDSSGGICDQYANRCANVRVIHKVNGGLGSARNAGFDDAIGKYVYFIDSDDYLDINALEVLYEEAEKNDLDILMFSAECFSDEEDVQYDVDAYKRTVALHEPKSGNELFEKLYLSKEYFASIPMRFYKCDFLRKGKYVFPEKIIHEDEAYGFLSLIEAERAECIPEQFYKRRFRKGSIMTSNQAYNSALGYVYTWEILVKHCHKLNIEERKTYLKFVHGFFSLILNLYYLSFDKKEQLRFKEVRKNLRETVSLCSENIGKGIKLFIISPLLYKLYRNLFNEKHFKAN